jgi:hypothetical protein
VVETGKIPPPPPDHSLLAPMSRRRRHPHYDAYWDGGDEVEEDFLTTLTPEDQAYVQQFKWRLEHKPSFCTEDVVRIWRIYHQRPLHDSPFLESYVQRLNKDCDMTWLYE